MEQLTVTMPKGASPIFIHGIGTAGAWFARPIRPGENYKDTLTDMLDDQLARRPIAVHSFTDFEYPVQLHGGESIPCVQPWASFQVHAEAGGWAKIRVEYSVARSSQIMDIDVEVDLPPPPKPITNV